MEKTFRVKGMHCASCGSVISKRLKKLEGIEACDVNYGAENAHVSFDPEKIDTDQMNEQIKPLGYTLVDPHATMDHSHHQMIGNEHAAHLGLNQTKAEKEAELTELSKKVQFGTPITFLTFVVMIWDLAGRYFSFIPNLPIPMPLVNVVFFLLSLVMLGWLGKPYVKAVGTFIKHRVANMDSLVGIGTIVAFVYSSIVFLLPSIAALLNLPEATYFDVTIVVIGFITLGKYLEARSKLRTGEAIEKLLNLQAKKALILKEGKEVEVAIEEVSVGDVMLVKPGQKVPLDGEIIKGSSSLDESMITGESIPVDKKVGNLVIGSTINKQGSLEVRATKVGGDTVLAQIIAMVEEAQGSKAPIERLADQISAVFVPMVLVLSVIVLIGWLVIGSQFMPFSESLTLGLLSFVGILVIACPCAMGLATPTAVIVGVGKAAGHGILIKNAESLEKMSSVNFMVLDKTGTITKGQPEVVEIIPTDGSTETEVLTHLASLEKHSEHPLAQAVVSKAAAKKVRLHEVSEFSAIEGKGLQGKMLKKEYFAGNLRLAKELSLAPDERVIERLTGEGKTPVILMTKKAVIGYVAIADTVKKEAREAIEALHKQGITIALLTGDAQKTAEYIAAQLGIDTVIAEVLPKDKAQEVQSLQAKGHVVAMVGDGINDAPALATADVGIAMGTGTDVAIESAGITLLGGNVAKLPQTVKLARATMNTIKQNLFWAFIYNIIGIPIAAGVLYPFLGILLNPAIAGAAMAFSSVSVVLNSLRLKAVKV